MEADKDWSLSYSYRDGDPVEVPGEVRLSKDERSVVLSVLKKHFDGIEAGAFKFKWLRPSPLDRALRGKPSGDAWKHIALSLSTNAHPIGELSDDERRLIYVRDVAACMVRELVRLASELGPSNSVTIGRASVLTKMSRRRLTRHLLSLDLKNPTWPLDAMTTALVMAPHPGNLQTSEGAAATTPTGTDRVRNREQAEHVGTAMIDDQPRRDGILTRLSRLNDAQRAAVSRYAADFKRRNQEPGFADKVGHFLNRSNMTHINAMVDSAYGKPPPLTEDESTVIDVAMLAAFQRQHQCDAPRLAEGVWDDEEEKDAQESLLTAYIENDREHAMYDRIEAGLRRIERIPDVEQPPHAIPAGTQVAAMPNPRPHNWHVTLAGDADRLITTHPARFRPVGQWLKQLHDEAEPLVSEYRNRTRGFILRSTFDGTESPFIDCPVSDEGAYQPYKAEVPPQWQAAHNAVLQGEQFDGVTWVHVFDGDLFWEKHQDWLAGFDFGNCHFRDCVFTAIEGAGLRAITFAAAKLLAEVRSATPAMSTVERQTRLLAVHWLLFEAGSDGGTIGFDAGPWHVDDGVDDGDFHNAGWVDITAYMGALTGKLIQCRRSAGVFLRNTLTRRQAAEPCDRSPSFADWCEAVGEATNTAARALPPNGQAAPAAVPGVWQDGDTPPTAGPRFKTADLLKMTKIGTSETLAKYVRLAGTDPPGRGKRNHDYTHEQAMKILEAVLKNSSEHPVREATARSLDAMRNPNQIRIKSENSK